MRKMRILGMAACALVLAAALSTAAVGDVSLTFNFTDLGPHVGQALSLRVVDVSTWVEVARVMVPEVLGASLQVDVAPFVEGKTYQIDYFLDQNQNGLYDTPPVDAAWRVFVSSIQGPGVVDVVHDNAFNDIAWPPLIDGIVSPNEYRHTQVDSTTGISLSWQNDTAILYIALVSPGTGWVGIGLDPTSRMQGANYILAAVSGGVLSITDEFGVSATLHRSDAVMNVIQAAGQESAGSTIVEFAIPLASGDAEDKTLVPGQTVSVLLALHASQDSFTTRHTARSSTVITLDGGI